MRQYRRRVMLFLVIVLLVGQSVVDARRDRWAAADDTALSAQDFGTTAGGWDQPVVYVTSLNDSGAGSLRAALSQGYRRVVFTVGGVINLKSDVSIWGPYVTIDGLNAPDPGITLANYGLDIRGRNGAHDIVVQGLRVRNAYDDGIRVAYGAFNVLIERVSVHGAGDGSIDITERAKNVTVAWSILARPKGATDIGALPKSAEKNMLIAYNASRITLHHNLFVGAYQRNPLVYYERGYIATDTTLDMRNNVVWGWGSGVGLDVRDGVRVNAVRNFFGGARDMDDAIHVDAGTGRAYLAGNVRADFRPLGRRAAATESQPFPAPAIQEGDPCWEAYRVVAMAGMRPLDEVDQYYVGTVTLPACR